MIVPPQIALCICTERSVLDRCGWHAAAMTMVEVYISAEPFWIDSTYRTTRSPVALFRPVVRDTSIISPYQIPAQHANNYVQPISALMGDNTVRETALVVDKDVIVGGEGGERGRVVRRNWKRWTNSLLTQPMQLGPPCFLSWGTKIQSTQTAMNFGCQHFLARGTKNRISDIYLCMYVKQLVVLYFGSTSFLAVGTKILSGVYLSIVIKKAMGTEIQRLCNFLVLSEI